MFKQIRTSEANREIVAQLTRKLGLGAENMIARIAFSYSLSQNRKLELTRIQDSKGKEYSSKVLFGDNLDIYVGMLCVHYGISIKDKDVGKYVKMHVDDGLNLIESRKGFDDITSFF